MIDSAQSGCYVALISLMLASNFVLIPVPVQLITSASAIVYIGSTLSLKLKHAREASGEKNEEVMKAEDAYMFPLLGSGVLLGLYILFKVFDKDLVNLLLTSYFALIGAYSLTEAFSPLLTSLLFKKGNKMYTHNVKVPFYGVYKLELSQAWMLTFVLASVFAAAWFQTKHYLLNNIFGISLSIKGIESLSLGSFKVGAILLCGLFFYDIFWVFGTDVMVTVATSFDAPIKLIFPREFATETEKQKNSILGLGDIVIPGIFVALLLRRAPRQHDEQRAGVRQALLPREPALLRAGPGGHGVRHVHLQRGAAGAAVPGAGLSGLGAGHGARAGRVQGAARLLGGGGGGREQRRPGRQEGRGQEVQVSC